MLFNSFEFALFFPIVTTGYFLLPHRARWAWLLAASCVFYMAFIPIYIAILALTIAVDYYAALFIERASGRRRRAALWISILVTCGILFLFKYYNFFFSSVAAFGAALDLRYPISVLRVILPIGLSFHTFQSLSYVIEVYRGNHRAERHFGIYALYVMFYPQLVAGPIERPQGLLDQFRVKHYFNARRMSGGLRLMMWGLFKKVVVADRLALIVNPAFDGPHTHQGLPLAIATFMFAAQIYCDFSGYSDMAIGAAQTMGFHLRANFNRPYAAKGVAEFWKRWHMSLSTWFRDYVYLPLGGNRVGPQKWVFNVFITFLLSGLWHGANWTFVVWGALHASYLAAGRFTRQGRNSLWRKLRLAESAAREWIAIGCTCLLVGVGWVFFRASTLADAAFILSGFTTILPQQVIGLGFGSLRPGALQGMPSTRAFIIGMCLIAVVEVVELLQSRGDRRMMLASKPPVVRWAAFYALGAAILFYGYFARTQFIYFQF